MFKNNLERIDFFCNWLLTWEGGYVNNPYDNGGATNKGVTFKTWQKVGYDKNKDGVIDLKDLKLVSNEDVRDRVLKPYYWDKFKCDQIEDDAIAFLCCQMAWGSGPATAIKKVQKCLGLVADGIVGKKTLGALKGISAFNKLKKMREEWFNSIVKNNPSQKIFLKGWMRRLDSIQYKCLTYNNGTKHQF